MHQKLIEEPTEEIKLESVSQLNKNALKKLDKLN